MLLQGFAQEVRQRNRNETGKETGHATVATQIGHRNDVTRLIRCLTSIVCARHRRLYIRGRLHRNIQWRTLVNITVTITGIGQIIGEAIANCGAINVGRTAIVVGGIILGW